MNMKHFLLAPDSFKGTMQADEVCDIWEEVILHHMPDAQVRRFPMADGGEGMVQAFLRICGGEAVTVRVSGPFGEPMDAEYGILPGGEAVLEMAACAGLPLVKGRKNPERATTFGVGEMLLHAAASGVRKVILGIGGSATNDCGIGMAAALGYRFEDASGAAVEPLALHMERIARIVPPQSMPALSVLVACDVDNPLYGPTGATYTFGAQKGITGEMAARLDNGLKNMAVRIKEDLGVSVADLPGAGAAGGLGAGAVAFLEGSLKPGIDLLLDMAGFDAALEQADIVFTGEGRIDWQSARGKVPVGVSRRCKRAAVPCVALCGSIGRDAHVVYDEGITAIFSAVAGITTFEELQRTCRDDMRMLADAVMRLLLLDRRGRLIGTAL